MTAIRWSARVTGLLILGLTLLFMFGAGFNPLALRATEVAQSAVLILALTGMAVLWRSELLGGALVVAGMVDFYAINYAASGRLPGGFMFPLCFVPGLLALLWWWCRRGVTVEEQVAQ